MDSIKFVRATAPDRRFSRVLTSERPMITEHLGLITIGTYVTWGENEFGFIESIDDEAGRCDLCGFKLIKAESLGINDPKELVQTAVRFKIDHDDVTRTVLVDYIHEITPRTQYFFKRVCFRTQDPVTMNYTTTVYNITASNIRDR